MKFFFVIYIFLVIIYVNIQSFYYLEIDLRVNEFFFFNGNILVFRVWKVLKGYLFG